MNKSRDRVTGLLRRLPFEGRRRALSWAYRRLSSIRTSIYVLAALAVFFVLGTIFPQGGSFDEYEKAGGRFMWLVVNMDLLSLFSSPPFLALSALLAANLAICTYERLKSLSAGGKAIRAFEPDRSILITHDLPDAYGEVRRVLKERLRFRVVDKDGEWVVMEKGLPYKWLTWAYHAGIIIVLFGVLLTFLFSFEETLTLATGESRTITPETTGRVQSLWKGAAGQTDYFLRLDRFSTEYVEAAELDYPADARSRFAIGTGWKAPAFNMKEDGLVASDWKAALTVARGSVKLLEKEIEINDPLEYGGYTIYLLGFEQKLKLRVNASPILMEASSGGEVLIPGTDAALSLGTMRTGKVTRLDGTTDELAPYVTVRKSGSAGEPAILKLGGSVIVEGVEVTLSDFTESAILSYRYDPGIGVLWAGGLITLIAMMLRFYGAYYLVAYRIDDRDAIVTICVHVTPKGLAADREALLNKLEALLAENDLKPEALASSV